MKNLTLLIFVLNSLFIFGQSNEKDFTYLVCDSNLIQSNNFYSPDEVDSNATALISPIEINTFLYNGLDSIKEKRNQHGKYFIHFTIDTIGQIDNVCILRPKNPYPYGKVLIETFKKLPLFSPALKDGTPVPSRNFFPINFCIGR